MGGKILIFMTLSILTVVNNIFFLKIAFTFRVLKYEYISEPAGGFKGLKKRTIILFFSLFLLEKIFG